MKGKIKDIKARQVLDSKGRPVVEVDIITEDDTMGRAGASTGTSVGSNEAYVLRDKDPSDYSGLSVRNTFALLYAIRTFTHDSEKPVNN